MSLAQHHHQPTSQPAPIIQSAPAPQPQLLPKPMSSSDAGKTEAPARPVLSAGWGISSTRLLLPRTQEHNPIDSGPAERSYGGMQYGCRYGLQVGQRPIQCIHTWVLIRAVPAVCERLYRGTGEQTHGHADLFLLPKNLSTRYLPLWWMITPGNEVPACCYSRG